MKKEDLIEQALKLQAEAAKLLREAMEEPPEFEKGELLLFYASGTTAAKTINWRGCIDGRVAFYD